MGAAEHLAPYRKLWKKGQSGNPGGRPKLPEWLRAVKALSQEEAARRVARLARMSPAELDVLVETRSCDVLDLSIARIFQESYSKGDWQRLAFLLDRCLGKVQIVEASDAEAEALREIQDLSDQELLRLVKEKLPELEKA